MARRNDPLPVRAPLAGWQNGRLLVSAVLLPVFGIALIAFLVASIAIRVGSYTSSRWYEPAGEIWRDTDLFRSVLVSGWLLVMGLGVLGLGWMSLAELRRRRQSPSPEEEQARQADAAETARRSLEQARGNFHTAAWCAALGSPGLSICVLYKALGMEPPQWATFLSLPLVAFAPLYWMQSIKIGFALWLHQGRPSRWLGYSALSFVVFFLAIGIGVFSFLRH